MYSKTDTKPDDSIINSEFAAKLCELRTARGWTEDELAAQTDQRYPVNGAMIRKFERCEAECSIAIHRELQDSLNAYLPAVPRHYRFIETDSRAFGLVSE